jgi:Uma2 family endonuclease
MSTAAMPPATPKPRPIPTDVPDGYELVDGKLRKLPMAAISSWVGKLVYDRLLDYTRSRRNGIAFPGETAFCCFTNKSTQVRKPDISVIAGDPITYVAPFEGMLQVVPLLVVEVVSPKERAKELAEKINDFRSVNTPLIWVIYPEARQATIYRADGSTALITDPGELSGEGVLPGFTLPLAAVLPPAKVEAPGTPAG